MECVRLRRISGLDLGEIAQKIKLVELFLYIIRGLLHSYKAVLDQFMGGMFLVRIGGLIEKHTTKPLKQLVL